MRIEGGGEDELHSTFTSTFPYPHPKHPEVTYTVKLYTAVTT
jgi:hypothetical protein